MQEILSNFFTSYVLNGAFWTQALQATEGFLLTVAQTVNNYLSNYILIFLLVGIGLFYTIKTRFVQVRCFGEGMKKVFGGLSLKGGKNKSGLSSFQALATAIAAQVGTGNIVGACGAILIGGPGAIFWMWVIAFFGMATIYSEAVLAQRTRIVDENGHVQGGPVYYIRRAFSGKFGKLLAGFFAVAIILALGFMGAMVQSNSIASSINNASSSLASNFGWSFVIPTWSIGILLAIVCAIIFIGGVQRIASVAEKIVPLMAVTYLLLGVIFLAANITKVPQTVGMIFSYAFNANAIIGGGFGAIIVAMTQGAKRGLFSNEAGMGSTPHAHAQANVKTPHEQGIVAMIGVFIDTFVVLTITALVVITAFYTDGGELADYGKWLANNQSGIINNGNMMQLAMSKVFGSVAGNILIAICLTFFAFTTIIGWNFFGKINVQYLFGKKATVVYSVLAIGFIFLGSVFKADLVWELTDVFNNLMVIPNVIALFALSGLVVKEIKQRDKEKRKLKKSKK